MTFGTTLVFLFNFNADLPKMPYAWHIQLTELILQHMRRGAEMCQQSIILMIAKFLLFGNPC